MIKKEMSHILGRDLAHEALSSAKKIDEGIDEIKKKLDDISRALGDEEKNREDRERFFRIQKNTEMSQEFLSNEYVALYCQAKSNKPKVLVCGFYGARNVGDELMLKAILDLIPVDDFEVTILLSNNYDLDASDYAPYRVLHYPKRSSDIVAIAENFDVVIWGGGAMLDDTDYVYCGQYSTMAYYLMAITKAIIKKGGKAFVYGVSANDKISNESFIKDLDYIVEKSDYFSLRDTNSLRVLEEAGVKTDKITIIDDLSIYSLLNKRLDLNKENDSVLCIGLNLILYEYRLLEYERIVKSLKNYFGKPIKVVLIPFYDYNNHDQILLEKIVDGLAKEKIECEFAKQPDNMEELLKIYEKCDYVFAMRYHAVLIASLMHKHAVMIDFQKNHRHYLNKNSYIKSNYVPELLVLEYDNLCKNGIPKEIKIPETGMKVKQRDEIAENIKKNVQASLKKIRRK